MKWKATISLLVLLIVMFSQVFWLWAIVFMIWVIPDLITGKTHLGELVERKQNPLLYWSIMLTWILYSIYLVVGYFVPEWLSTL